MDAGGRDKSVKPGPRAVPRRILLDFLGYSIGIQRDTFRKNLLRYTIDSNSPESQVVCVIDVGSEDGIEALELANRRYTGLETNDG